MLPPAGWVRCCRGPMPLLLCSYRAGALLLQAALPPTAFQACHCLLLCLLRLLACRWRAAGVRRAGQPGPGRFCNAAWDRETHAAQGEPSGVVGWCGGCVTGLQALL